MFLGRIKEKYPFFLMATIIKNKMLHSSSVTALADLKGWGELGDIILGAGCHVIVN